MSHPLSLTSSHSSKRAKVPLSKQSKAKETEFPKRLPGALIKKILENLSCRDYGVSRTVCKSLRIMPFDTWMRQNGTVEFSIMRRFLHAEKRPPLEDADAAASPFALAKSTGSRIQQFDLSYLSDLQSISEFFPEGGPVLYPQLKKLHLRFEAVAINSPEKLKELEAFVKNIVRHCPMLIELNLQMATRDLLLLLVKELKLQKLDLRTSQLDWPEELSKMDNLKEVDLTLMVASHNELAKIKDIPQLRTLRLDWFAPLQESFQSIAQLTQLKRLELGPHVKLTYDFCFINNLSNLEMLHLKTNDATMWLPDILQLSSNKLRHFHLSSFHNLDLISNIFGRNAHLQSLVLNNCGQLTDGVLQSISKSWRLKHLEFDLEDQSRISNVGLFYLSQSPSIETLKIKARRSFATPQHHDLISERGLIVLANNPHLKVLDLSEFNYPFYLDLDSVEKELFEKKPKLSVLRSLPITQESVILNFFV